MLDNSYGRTYYFPMDQRWLYTGKQRKPLNGGKFAAVFLSLLTLMMLNLGCLKSTDSDEVRYHRLSRQLELDLQNKVALKRAGKAWNPDDTSQDIWVQYKQLEQKWLSSGFLTNLSITLAPVGSIYNQESIDTNFSEAWPRLDNLLPNDFLPSKLEINAQSNTVIYEVTCPTSDVPFITKFVWDNIFKTNSSCEP